MKKMCSAMLVLICLFAPCRVLAAEATEPADMAEFAGTGWCSESVIFCIERGIMKPDESTPFDPNALLSKIEFIAMISRAYGLYDDAGQPLYLTKDGHYAAAVERGLLTEGEFSREDWATPVGRFEVASVCYRALLAVGGYVEDGNEVYIDNASDKDAMPQQYHQAVNGVQMAGVMNGTDAALTFRGWDGITKAQGCVILHRLLDVQTRRPPTVPAAYGTLFSSCTTSYGITDGKENDEYQRNSIFNMLKAGAAINGVVLAPGEEFSFNKTVGNPGQANGYRLGTIVFNGKKVPGYGGGVCQTSTTLFDAALDANMTIKERHNHGLKSAYVPAGADSAIFHPYLDLKFQNPYDCPVKIVFDSDPDAETMTVKLYGVADTYTPTVAWSIAEQNGVYTLTRCADGVTNYSCTSKYKD